MITFVLLFGIAAVIIAVVVSRDRPAVQRRSPAPRAQGRSAAANDGNDLNQALLTSTVLTQLDGATDNPDGHHHHGAGHGHIDQPTTDHGHGHHTHTDHSVGSDCGGHHSAPDTSSFDAGSHHH